MTSARPVSPPLPHANKGDLTQGTINRHLLRLSLPMLWGIAVNIIAQLTDTYFVAQLGTRELAAISFTFPVTMILSHLVFGLNIAMSSNVSRLIGQRDMPTVHRIVQHGLSMAVMASTATALMTYFLLDSIFSVLGADNAMIELIRQYMPLWLIASVVLSIPVNGNSAIRASGDALSPALVMSIAAIANVILDPILIFGWFGAPAMGIEGAALATLISYILCAAVGLFILIGRKKLLHFDHFYRGQYGDSFKRFAVIAIPAGLTNTLQPLMSAVLTALVAPYGAHAVAALGVASRVQAFCVLAVIALGLGMAPVIGQNWGAKIFDRVRTAIKHAIEFNFIWSFLVTGILAIFGTSIASLFSSEPEVIQLSALYFWIVPFSFAFANLIFVWSSAFNATGKPIRSFIMISTQCIVIGIPAFYIGEWLGGLIGLFIAIAVTNVACGIFFHWFSRRALTKDIEAQNINTQ